MSKKIDQTVREFLRELCIKSTAGEIISNETRSRIKGIAENYLNYNGYKIERVICDERNNPPDIVDSNSVKIEVWEETIPGYSEKKIHTIML